MELHGHDVGVDGGAQEPCIQVFGTYRSTQLYRVIAVH